MESLIIAFGKNVRTRSRCGRRRRTEQLRDVYRDGGCDRHQRVERDVDLAALDLTDVFASGVDHLSEAFLTQAAGKPQDCHVPAHAPPDGAPVLSHEARLLDNSVRLTTPIYVLFSR